MKKYILIIFIALLPVISMAETGYTAIIHSPKFADSVYFSVKSLCNIKVDLTKTGIASAMINNKKHEGRVRKNKNTDGYYDFVAKDAILFMFTFNEGKMLIVNQQYQFDCEDAKVIELSRLTDSQSVLADFNDYIGFNSTAWDNIASINDKAYYLGQLKFYQASVAILEQVVEKKPGRVVAWLNLADGLWELGEQNRAVEAYNKYLSLMKQQNKDGSKIPPRVTERTKKT